MRMSINGCESGKRKSATATGPWRMYLGWSVRISVPKSQTSIFFSGVLVINTTTNLNLSTAVPHNVQFLAYSCVTEMAHEMQLGRGGGEEGGFQH